MRQEHAQGELRETTRGRGAEAARLGSKPGGALPAQAQFLLSLHETAGNRAVSGLVQRLREGSEDVGLLHASPPAQRRFAPVQRQRTQEDELRMRAAPSAPTPLEPEPSPRRNDSGLPRGLKSGIESLSGISLDDVNVYYNSAKPAHLNALAYAQGSDIHVAAGQEHHLPHEAWHVVQQAQGRVQPTMQMTDGVPVNDDEALEHEADAMGARALQRADDSELPPEDLGSGVSQLMGNRQQTIQLFDWASSTALTTIYDFIASPSWEGAKDIVDPRRSRLNPLNMIEGVTNLGEETAGGNYHSSSKHGAHNTVRNAMNRIGGTMANKYTGAVVPPQGPSQGRFNSEAWESFSWRKAKELFSADIGVPVTWVAGPFHPRSSWNVCLNHVGSDVGISQTGLAGAINSVSGVRVAVNYRPVVGGVGVEAYNGQMYPTAPAAPPPGAVLPGHPVGVNMNGTIQAVPYKFLGYFGI